MRTRLSALTLCALGVLSTALVAHAADADWQKSYPVQGKPSLTLSSGDTSMDVHGCGECRDVRIRVEWNERRPSDYILSESQSGNHISFEMREKSSWGMHIQIGNRRAPHLTVETPASVDLEARTADGSLRVAGVTGELQLRTTDGSVDVGDVGGALHLAASDGSIRIHNASGTLESRSSDGSVHIDGRFTGLQVKTSDGSLDLTIAEGSRLATASRVESSDGRVVIHMPRTLAADLEVHAGDGSVQCDLPLTMDGYNSHSDSNHNLRGRLNGGGVPLAIQTHDGNVTIAAL